MADRADEIGENAVAPAKISGDRGSVEQHSIPDQIAGDRYARASEAARKPLRGMRVTLLRSPGTT
jgi:hypothetical protein